MITMYRQKTTAGGAFDATDPGDPSDTDNLGVQDWPAHATGGLFPTTDRPQWLEAFHFHAGAAASWSLVAETTDGTDTWDTVLFSGTSDTDFASGGEERYFLPPGTTLKLTASCGTSAKMSVLVVLHDRLID